MKSRPLTRSAGRLVMAVAILAGLLLLHGAGTAVADFEPPRVSASGPTTGSLPGCITIRWDHSGSGVYEFSVERQSPSWRWDNVNAAQRDLLDCGLEPDTTYQYRVCVYFITEDGDVECSDWESGRTRPAESAQRQQDPPAPRIDSHEAGETWLRICWRAGFDYDSYFVNYEEQASPGSPRTVVRTIDHENGGAQGCQRIDGLVPGRAYMLGVQGCTETLFGIADDKCWAWSAGYPVSTRGPAGMTASFESVNVPGHFIRHRFALGHITPVRSDLDRADATWHVRPALSGTPGAVSFESVNYPGTFLRHQDFRIKQQRNDGSDLFKRDASFIPRTALSGTHDAVSFESVNVPGHYIRHQDFELWLANRGAGNTALFPRDASYFWRTPR